jgi:uncharacterized protein (DUF2252 family)
MSTASSSNNKRGFEQMIENYARSRRIPPVDTATLTEFSKQGRTLRAKLKRSSLGTKLDFDRDPVKILEGQNSVRIPELVPVRMGRMAQSPFAFYRGAAAVMAHDLATTPITGITVQACGDCHLLNFGFFASPERELIFDLNDFDETLPGPWEWDVERLVASLAIAAQANGLSDAKARDMAAAAAREYRNSTAWLAGTGALRRFHLMVTAGALRRRLLTLAEQGPSKRRAIKQLKKSVGKARLRTSEHALAQLSIAAPSGAPRIVDQPPLIVHSTRVREDVPGILRKYRASVPPDVDALLEHFKVVDFALKVVGVGSVGTHCYIALTMDAKGRSLFLQVKQATASVTERYTRRSALHHHGRRVVAGQQIMQAASDPFLGWSTAGNRHYYVRQFRDMKGSINIEKLDAASLMEYSGLCGAILARAHAQTTEPAVIAGYLGNGPSFDEAMGNFALAYAQQNEADHAALLRAVKSGGVQAETGV